MCRRNDEEADRGQIGGRQETDEVMPPNENRCNSSCSIIIHRQRMKIGFDNEKYLKVQSEQIKKRIGQFGDKLYLEFGGKLFDDNHASRVLPGFFDIRVHRASLRYPCQSIPHK